MVNREHNFALIQSIVLQILGYEEFILVPDISISFSQDELLDEKLAVTIRNKRGGMIAKGNLRDIYMYIGKEVINGRSFSNIFSIKF